MEKSKLQSLINTFNQNSNIDIQGLKDIFNVFAINFEEQERAIFEMRNHNPMSKGPQYINPGMGLNQIPLEPEMLHNTLCELTGLSELMNPKFPKEEIQKYFDLQFGTTIETQIIEVIKGLRLLPSDVKKKTGIINGSFIKEWKMIEENSDMTKITIIGLKVCPRNITTLKNLKQIEFFGDVKFGDPLPEIIAFLTQIESLSTRYCNHIPELKDLKNLTKLFIDHIEWEFLPPWFTELNLEKLRLDNGQTLKELPKDWGNLKNTLKKLDLNFCENLKETKEDLKKRFKTDISITLYN